MLSDNYHKQYYDLVETVMAPLNQGGNPNPPSDNNLINGKMNFDCSTVAAGDTTPCNSNAGISKFTLTTGKTHLLRLINAGSEGLQRFSIDGHELTIIANDFVPVVSLAVRKLNCRILIVTQTPYQTKVVTLASGQRSDVLVTANQGHSNSAFWMRSNISTICSSANQPNALAAVYYDKADTNKAPTSAAWNVPDPGTCRNDDLSLTVPQFAMAPAAQPEATREIELNYYINASDVYLWTLNSTSYRADYNSPVLLAAEEGNTTFGPEVNVEDWGSYPSVRVVITNPTNHSHPMHLHGHNMFILQEGTGTWDGSIVNPQNPQRRDVQLLAANSYTVWQITADNPGVWPYHCHVVWHTSSGLYMNILERPQDIQNAQKIPMIMQQTCTDWDAFSKSSYVDQIDSGL
jgi:FtsP/CotA-like multicopper oxidase with cupredoxin domain